MAFNEETQEKKAAKAIWKLIQKAESYVEQIRFETHRDDNGDPYEVERSDLLGLTNAAILYMEAYTYTGSPKIKNTNTLHHSLKILHERYMDGTVARDSEKQRSLEELIGILKAMVLGIESETFHVIAPSNIASDIARTIYEISKYPPDYISDEKLRKIAQRDLEELKLAVKAEMPKSVALLIGSILEGVLLAVVGLNPAVAQSYFPKRSFPDAFGIAELMHVCLAQNLLDKELTEYVDSLNHYRDLIHPNREKDDDTKLDDCSIAHGLSLLRLVLRSLSDSGHNDRIIRYQHQ